MSLNPGNWYCNQACKHLDLFTMVRFSLNIKTRCLCVTWKKTRSNLGKIFCIPKNMHSRTPTLCNANAHQIFKKCFQKILSEGMRTAQDRDGSRSSLTQCDVQYLFVLRSTSRPCNVGSAFNAFGLPFMILATSSCVLFGNKYLHFKIFSSH